MIDFRGSAVVFSGTMARVRPCAVCRRLFKVFRESGEARARFFLTSEADMTALNMEGLNREADQARQALTEHLAQHVSIANQPSVEAK